MEMNKEVAAEAGSTGTESLAVPERRFVSKSSSMVQTEDKIVQNIDKKGTDSSKRNLVSKSKSFNGSVSVRIDIDGVPENVGESVDETGNSAIGQSSPIEEEESDSLSKWKNARIEPTIPLTLLFQDVKYKVNSEKYILHGITGSANPGEFLALMGPSGSGKTTLLNLLSGRVQFNSGTITYNGRPHTNFLKRRIGYVTQDDVVFSHLTVKETLTYAALLRLPKIFTRQEKIGRAMNVIAELGLERSQNTVIGGNCLRGNISGGERKRVCIGHEILLNPSLLFLDEPTSGLDSTTALRIVRILQKMAKDGKTIVTTIHQPSSKIFSTFDKLILLGKGSCLYYGKASEATVHFSSIGCSTAMAMNPAEFLIDLANGTMSDKSFPSHRNLHEYLVEAYEAKVAKLDNRKLLKSVVKDGDIDIQGKLNPIELWAPTWLEQFTILLCRSFKERRHEHFSFMRVTQVAATAMIIGLLWWNCNASSNELEDQAGLLFFISVFWSFFPLFTAIFTFPEERKMIAKERAVGMYRLDAYFAARNITDLPLDLLMPTVFIVIVYFMVGLQLSFPAFSLTMLTVFLCIIASQGLGLAIGAAFMDVKKATTLASVIVMTFMLSGGFFLQKVAWFMSWMRYVSLNYHTYRLLLKIHQPYSEAEMGAKEVLAMMVMIVAYRLLAYFLLRKMKLTNLS